MKFKTGDYIEFIDQFSLKIFGVPIPAYSRIISVENKICSLGGWTQYWIRLKLVGDVLVVAGQLRKATKAEYLVHQVINS